MSRASRYTPTSKKIEIFSDFTRNLDKNPITKNVSKITNENAVVHAMKNLLFTNFGERLYQPLIGGNLSRMLFEPIDNISTARIRNAIKDTLKNNEPRVRVHDVNVLPNEEKNLYDVSIIFSLINNPSETLQTNIVLHRVR